MSSLKDKHLNIQTEKLENHTARFTVAIEPARLDKAKETAARSLSKRVSIPGFRKGKAPYKLLVSYVGEAAILENAVEILGDEVYKQVLKESEIQPYGPGQFEDFKLEPDPTFIFTVPLQPTVVLGDYRAIRLDYEPPVVEDKIVDRALKLLQEQEAVVEESHQPVALGNRVTADIHSFYVDEDHQHEETESDEEETADIDQLHSHDDEEVFVHEHGAVLRLEEGEDEPIIPGFSAALVGANVGEMKEFELTIPDDEEEYGEDAGKKVKFHVVVSKIETLTLPPLNDELAARVTQKEEKPLTLLELRMRMRENLQNEAERRAKSNYSSLVLDEIVKQATISFPEDLVQDQIKSMMDDLDRRFRQQGMTLDDYARVANKTREEIAADYRESAIRIIQRQLTTLELIKNENIQVDDQNIDAELDVMSAQFGEQAASFRSALNTPQMRSNIGLDLLQQKLFERIADVAMGKTIEETSREVSGEDVTPSEANETEG
jgi:trigger factor